MIKVFSKITSILLAILLVLSTTSFTIEKYFCGGKLVGVSFFGEKHSCKKESSCKSFSIAVSEKKSCCKNERIFLSGEKNIFESTIELKQNIEKYTILFFKPNTISDAEFVFKVYDLKKYYSLQIVYNIRLLYQVFIL
ncbi:HYC_CC_PP family protein [Tenacibaculum sp. C7A-26P2]|uniref:HYC_CC_PP family protein n=1 Tax=Tenacibaculum sp. C7A-26P2 TaxID=3447504 RepID=UPI003F8421E3